MCAMLKKMCAVLTMPLTVVLWIRIVATVHPT